MTDLSLKPLFSALSGEACPKFELVANGEDCGQLTFAFPDRFIDHLAGFDESRTEQLIASWRESGEAPYDNEGDLRALLASLKQLARSGREAGHGMFLWNSI